MERFMASERKPSIYSDRRAIGSAEELDEYGVWVKSDPQDLSSPGVEIDGFTEFSLPDIEETPAFDAGLENSDLILELPDMPAFPVLQTDTFEEVDENAGFADLEIPVDAEPPDAGIKESGKTEAAGGAAQDLSTQLLMKIANELASIRTELTTLKKEFAGIRSTASEGEVPHENSFSEEDEKIALTGDEMDTILNTADFIEEPEATAGAPVPAGAEETGVESGEPEMDDLPLPEPEAADETGAGLDALEMDDLSLPEPQAADETGADLDALEIDDLPLPEPEAADETGADFDVLEIDDLPLPEPQAADETGVASDEAEEEEIDIDLDDLGIDLDNLGVEDEQTPEQALSEELDVSLNADFDIGLPTGESLLSEDPFPAEAEASAEELPPLGADDADPIIPAAGDMSYLEEDPIVTEGTGISSDVSLNGDALDLSLDESALELADESAAEPAAEHTFDTDSLDLSEAVIDDPDLSAALAENPVEEPSFDDLSITLEDDDTLAQVIPEGFEIGANKSEASLDDEDFAIPDLEEESLPEPDLHDAAEKAETASEEMSNIPAGLKNELKNVLSYMDHLLESLPEEKIEEFAKSEYFDSYKKIFKELGLV
jgi:hypothetical protein